MTQANRQSANNNDKIFIGTSLFLPVFYWLGYLWMQSKDREREIEARISILLERSAIIYYEKSVKKTEGHCGNMT